MTPSVHSNLHACVSHVNPPSAHPRNCIPHLCGDVWQLTQLSATHSICIRKPWRQQGKQGGYCWWQSLCSSVNAPRKKKKMKSNWEGSKEAKRVTSCLVAFCPIIWDKRFHIYHLSQNFAFSGGRLLSVAVILERQRRSSAFPWHTTPLHANMLTDAHTSSRLLYAHLCTHAHLRVPGHIKAADKLF